MIPGGLAMTMFPQAASDHSQMTDIIFVALLIMSFIIALLIFGMMLRFIVYYRSGSNADRTNPIAKTWTYEVTWFTVSIAVSLGLFIWAAWRFYEQTQAPDDAEVFYVTGRQWMWEIQHPDGVREINSLHIATGQPIKLVISSQDVIHSFYVPVFRIKQDAVPGRFTTMWFTPIRPGRYHLFCAEYCGAEHSLMRGWVTVMEPEAYQQWLEGVGTPITAQPTRNTSRASFRVLGCMACHKPDSTHIAPRLEGLFGSTVTLNDGSTLRADEQYIRESIVNPAEKITRGYQPIMPTYKGLLSERQIQQLIEAVRGLKDAQREPGTP